MEISPLEVTRKPFLQGKHVLLPLLLLLPLLPPLLPLLLLLLVSLVVERVGVRMEGWNKSRQGLAVLVRGTITQGKHPRLPSLTALMMNLSRAWEEEETEMEREVEMQ